VGEQVTKGQVLIEYSDYIFNPNMEIAKLVRSLAIRVPILTLSPKRIDRNGVLVDVIEVVDPKPFNKARKESNEQKSRRPLRFGSLTDVSTAGNWE